MDSQERTALVVLVPEAETLVQAFRNRYDPSAAEGVPAHITVRSPFKYAGAIGREVVHDLQVLFSQHSRFSFTLESRRFPTALYLAPRPDAPFAKLTRAVAARYPETPPYGGAFATVVPHLTIAQMEDPRQLEEIGNKFACAARGSLPIHSRVEKVWVVQKHEGRWKLKCSFALKTA
jgi:hypothetical protein